MCYDTLMNIEISRSKRKTMSILVRDGRVIVKAPYGTSDTVIESFVAQKTSWIEKHLQAYEPLGYHHKSMDRLRVFGVYKHIISLEGSPFKIVESADSIEITIPPSMSESRINQRVDDYFKEQLELRLDALVCLYAWRLKLKTPPYKVRRYKRLYGRCNQNHELAFNTYLYHESLPFIHYVVLHECAHIIEFNHSDRFYNVISSIMPTYKAVIRSNKIRPTSHLDQ
ncbi:DUF45 domain-containing protein [Erysipelothrix rhusiopathiae]|nr:DUF45 domain-containing protein [Erysipelothrix sp. strain 2 (EsS2-7-Brazil)]NBA01964.1 DUF45 domain-containing protein [Erysipelothrix rhusiopathiae]